MQWLSTALNPEHMFAALEFAAFWDFSVDQSLNKPKLPQPLTTNCKKR